MTRRFALQEIAPDELPSHHLTSAGLGKQALGVKARFSFLIPRSNFHGLLRSTTCPPSKLKTNPAPWDHGQGVLLVLAAR